MLTAISRESWETHLQLGVNTFIYAVQSICQNTTRLCLVKYSNTISNVACLASLSGEPFSGQCGSSEQSHGGQTLGVGKCGSAGETPVTLCLHLAEGFRNR